MSDSTPLNAAPSNWCPRITNRARRGGPASGGSSYAHSVECPR